MHERGRVITVRDGAVDVRVEQGSAACEGCSACSRTPSGDSVIQSVRDQLGATVGDTVDIIIPDAVRSRAAVAVFVVPVACMLLGYLAGYLLSNYIKADPDVAGLIGALAFGAIAFAGVRLAERVLSRNEQYMPKVNAIISRGCDRP